ncbi:hypothetical protein [Methylobacterium sp. A54F]
MFFLAATAIGGGAATSVMFASFGPLVAILCAPLGGSLGALAGAVYLAHRRGGIRRSGTSSTAAARV